MTSTSSKVLIAILAFTLVSGFTTAQEDIFSQDRTGSTDFDDTGFQIPEYDSQEEILFNLVVPFLFLTVLLNLVMTKVLHFILRDDSYESGYVLPPGIPMERDQPKVERYSLFLSIAITAMLIPTPFWNYVTWVTASIGFITLLGFFLMVLFILYLMSGLAS